MTVDFAALADALPAEDAIDPGTAATVEDVLQIADAWRAGELPLPEALALITAEPRAIGTAFRHAWTDPRRPALEALHAMEYGRRYGMVHTTFGWLHGTTWDQVMRHMAGPDVDALRYHRKAA